MRVRSSFFFWRMVAAVLAGGAFVCPLMAAQPLFPKALHLSRRVDDPMSHRTSQIEQYCAGNRVVSIDGTRVAIVDYDRQNVTEIDHARGTYSVTRFDEIANAGASVAHAAAKPSTAKSWTATPLGVQSSPAAGRSMDAFAFASQTNARRTMHVGVDRGVVLSRGALDALIGASYPNRRGEEHDPAGIGPLGLICLLIIIFP